MATIPKTGIVTSNTIEASHVTNIIDALDGTTSREIKVPGSVEVTGSLNTRGSNTHVGVNTFSNEVNITETNSALFTRLVELENSSAVTVDMQDYGAGTTFEIDLSNSTNNIDVRLGECPDILARIEYHFTFSNNAASGADFILSNAAHDAQGLNSNTNSKFTVTASTGTVTSNINGLLYTRVTVSNVRKSAGNPFWFIQIWSDDLLAFTIS